MMKKKNGTFEFTYDDNTMQLVEINGVPIVSILDAEEIVQIAYMCDMLKIADDYLEELEVKDFELERRMKEKIEDECISMIPSNILRSAICAGESGVPKPTVEEAEKIIKEKLGFLSDCLMSIEDYRRGVDAGGLTSDDGCGEYFDIYGECLGSSDFDLESIDMMISEGVPFVAWYNK